MLHRNWFVAICLIIYSLIILLPPIIHGYIYPNLGDDASYHLKIIKSADLWWVGYYAYVYVGYPIRWLSSITGLSINVLFLWFNYLVFVAVGFCFYFVLSRLVNRKAGVLALVIPTFLSGGLLSQFDFGMIYNIIEIGIILPLLIYCVIKWIKNRRVYQLVLSLILSFLFSTIHMGGVYLVPIVALLLGGVYVYTWRKKVAYDYGLMIFMVALIVVGVVGQYLLVNPARFAITNGVVVVSPTLENGYLYSVLSLVAVAVVTIVAYVRNLRFVKNKLWILFLLAVVAVNIVVEYLIVKPESFYIVNSPTGGVYTGSGNFLPLAYILVVLSPYTIWLLALSLWFVDKDKLKAMRSEIKLLIVILGTFALVLGGVTFAGITMTPDRTLFDMTTPFALLTVIFASLAWDYSKTEVGFPPLKMSEKRVVVIATLAFMCVGLVSCMPGWFGFRSAVKEVDMQAISYINAMPYKTYTTSPEVMPRIYDQFTRAQFDDNSLELLIKRNRAMTPHSDRDSRAYIPHGTDAIDGFMLDHIFSDGEIEVSIYIKDNK